MPSLPKWTVLSPPHETKYMSLENETSSSRETSPETPLTEKLAPKRKKKKGTGSLVRELDLIRRPLKGYGYGDAAYLLADTVVVKGIAIYCPTRCYHCDRYGHSCSGQAGKKCGRCIRDRQRCISPEEYKKDAAAKAAAKVAAKEQAIKAAQAEAAVKEQATNTAQAKAGSSRAVPPTVPKDIVGRRACYGDTDGTVKELAENADEVMRELHARIAELGSLQAALMKKLRGQ